MTADYRVAAVNADGQSPYSNTANVVVPALPAAPANLAATLQPGLVVDLSWTDNASNETGFIVERSINGGAFVQIGTAAALAGTGTVAFSDNTVEIGTTVDYQVAAINLSGMSAYSNIANVIVPTVPKAPTNLTTILQTGLKVRLNWRDNATNETEFIIERSGDGINFTQISTAPLRIDTGFVSFVDNTIQAGFNYLYRVAAVNINGMSAYSNTASVSVPPAAPSNAKATLQTGPKVRLTWRDNAINETGFIVERSIDGVVFTQLGTAPALAGTGTVSFVDTAVQAGLTLTYRVAAVNGNGSSVYSNKASVSVPGLPAAPGNFTVRLGPNPTANTRSLILKWDDLSNNESGFTIQRATNQQFTQGLWEKNGGANVITYADKGLPANTAFYYRIRANNGTIIYSVWVKASPFPVTTRQ